MVCWPTFSSKVKECAAEACIISRKAASAKDSAEQWLLSCLPSVIALHILSADSPQLQTHHHRLGHASQVQQCQASARQQQKKLHGPSCSAALCGGLVSMPMPLPWSMLETMKLSRPLLPSMLQCSGPLALGRSLPCRCVSYSVKERKVYAVTMGATVPSTQKPLSHALFVAICLTCFRDMVAICLTCFCVVSSCIDKRNKQIAVACTAHWLHTNHHSAVHSIYHVSPQQ